MSAKTADLKSTNRTNFNNTASSTTSPSASSSVLNREEIARFGDALKNNEFRKLFEDYCKRKLLESDKQQLEVKRGVLVLHPEPGFVLKTAVNDSLQCFINVAKSELVAKPTSEVCLNTEKGTRCLNWSIPIEQSAPYDLDEHGKPCRIYNVIFHPDALYLAQKNSDFRENLIETALDAVESEYKVTLDRQHLEYPKMQFKGIARPTVIPKLARNISTENQELPPPEVRNPAKTIAPISASIRERGVVSDAHAENEFSTPKYTIKYRREVDFAEYIKELDANLAVTQPYELILEIELPLLNSTADCELDVTSQAVYLLSERANAKYHLKLELPHTVDDKRGSARFDIDTRRLCITLPIVQQPTMRTALQLNREDSGVESDMREEANSNNSDEHSSVDEAEKDEEDVNSALNNDVAVSKQERINTSFLNDSVHYQFPAKFDCNVLDNTISFVLHQRNVQAESLLMAHHDNDLHLRFKSIGIGCQSTYYAFYLQLPASNSTIVTTDVEAWENNVVLNLNMSSCSEKLQNYLAGIDKNDLKEYTVFNKFQVLRNSRQRKKSTTASQQTASVISIERSECERAVEIEIKPQNPEDEDEETEDSEHQWTQKKFNKKQKRKNKKRRSLSESACDDIKAYEEIHKQHLDCFASLEEEKETEVRNNDAKQQQQQQHKVTAALAVPLSPSIAAAKQQRKQRSYSECRDSANGSAGNSFKGILKHYSRYNSASSIDESLSSYSCSVEAAVSHSIGFSQSFSDIPEEQHENAELSESCKKTVRFNEVIKKQVFRNHSSILGQRKKNQKRRDRKQRALQRRLSEGDSADYDEDKLVALPTEAQYFKNKNKMHEGNNNNNNASSGLRRQTQHDSGLDLTTDKIINERKSTKLSKTRARLESESSSDLDVNKNALMFEMDM